MNDKTPKVRKTQELAYELKVKDAMNKDVITISPEETMSDVRNILRDKRISGLPVKNGDKLVGIISIEDLIGSLLKGAISEKVKDKMAKKVLTIYSDAPLIHAISKFKRYGFGRFPVIDRETKRLIGILTKGDIIECLLKKLEIDYHEEEIHKYRASHIFKDIISNQSTLSLRYYVEGSNFKKAGEQSSKLKRNLLRLGFAPDIIRRVTIASYEAEMNLVIFTSGGELVAKIEPEKITVTAIDKGPGIPDIKLVMQPGYSTAPDWVRELGFGAGMGLPNIKNCSDEMDLKSEVGKGTKLKFTVYIGKK